MEKVVSTINCRVKLCPTCFLLQWGTFELALRLPKFKGKINRRSGCLVNLYGSIRGYIGIAGPVFTYPHKLRGLILVQPIRLFCPWESHRHLIIYIILVIEREKDNQWHLLSTESDLSVILKDRNNLLSK